MFGLKTKPTQKEMALNLFQTILVIRAQQGADVEVAARQAGIAAEAYLDQCSVLTDREV